MKHYANHSGQSNVKGFLTGADHIVVEFMSGSMTHYKYTHASAGSAVIEHMKTLAHQGVGLNSFISRTKPGYAIKGTSLESVA